MKQFLRSFLTLLMLVVWASGFAASGDIFTLVTAESELKAGDVIIIVNQENSVALSTMQKKNNRGESTVTILGKNVTSANDTQEITLEGAAGAWYLNVGSGYLFTADNKSAKLLTQDTKDKNAKASISITSTTGEATIKFLGHDKYNIIKKNSQNNLFACYSLTNNQKPVAIYKKASTKTLTSLEISGDATKKAYNDGDVFDPAGLVVTGTYDDNTTATITNGITWTTTPATLTVGNTFCSVTATVNGITSPAYEVKGLTVTKTLTLSIDPATSTVVKAPVTVTLTANGDATVYYTTNGDDPSTSSTKYDAPFEVRKSGTTVKAIAVAEGAENATAEATYTIKPEQPVFSDETKTFKDAFDVTLTLPESTDPTSTIHYAIGKDATAESPLYEGPINISAENDGDKVILRAVVVDQYGNVGKQKYCTYTKTTAIVYDFTANPNAWGITPQKSNSKNGSNVVAGKELKVSGVMMTATNGSQYGTCLYGTTSVTLNVYQGGSITFTAPEGYDITEITFDKTNSLKADKGTYNNGTWTGNAHAVKFSNSGSKIEIKTATIKLVASTLSLNETTTEEDAKTLLGANLNKTVDVTINRTLVANKWNTLCLPFDVTAEQIKNILKAEGMVREYADDDATAQTITFKKVEGNMKAGEPYLIKPTEDITSLGFEGVTITAIEGNLQGKAYGICGTLGKYTMNTDGTELFLNAAGKFVAPAAATNTMKGFRAYFIVPKGASAAAININIDGETTGINNIETEATVNGKVYNLNGQYVGNSLNGLKKGIYVVNGKKVIK